MDEETFDQLIKDGYLEKLEDGLFARTAKPLPPDLADLDLPADCYLPTRH